MQTFDLLISGAGPAGLCLARALSGAGLSIGVVEQQPQAVLADPSFDGREIALTQRSADTLRRLGLWERIQAFDAAALSPLRDAQVLNGPSSFAMVIGHGLTRRSELGWLVSNHLIRRAAWDAVQDSIARHGDITLIAADGVAHTLVDEQAAQITLASGAQLRARLLVAADSRFSATRRAVGIGASQHDFGRTMLVFQVTHDEPHHHTAWEWFGHAQTLALLPMNNDPATGEHRASVVLTLAHQRIEPLLTLDEPAFNADITRRFDHRLGAMRLTSTRHAYPLVGVYPHRMVATRFACVGDAAVGMHPVTAHGFNFGLRAVETLSRELLAAQAAGCDIGAPEPLARYQRKHRLATRPLYEITRFIATLYTNEAPPARLLRDAALRLGQRLTPFKRAVAASLAGGR
ncbi:MAG: 5-demethoxyubiquinol-8 5-hydroxylase UbiM [Burkholderiaceae bacterium]|jgi:ubiquinone biosynthesis UbiH/UbiF/VisC/COQ6 family hydroxylase|nr:5-demethoxyubiquinol-8 5-hydroxylase UbiM [Burkholderiaceae bacterium]